MDKSPEHSTYNPTEHSLLVEYSFQASFIENSSSLVSQLRDLQDSANNSNKHRNCDRDSQPLDSDSNKRGVDLNRLKYRKLRQRLLTLCYKHDDLCLGKQVTSSVKPRIMKLSIELEKQVNNQVKDFNTIESILKEFFKLIEQKKQNDLHIIRQSKFIPSIMDFFKKTLSSHKSQYRESLKLIELANKILLHFCCLSINRQYMLLTNRLHTLVCLLKWALVKREEITQLSQTRLIPNLLHIITLIIEHRAEADEHIIVEETIEYTFYAQVPKKIKTLLEGILSPQDGLTEQNTAKSALRFLTSIFTKLSLPNKNRCIDEIESANPNCIYALELLTSFLSQYAYNIVFDKDKTLRQDFLPDCHIAVLLYILRFMNLSNRINLIATQKSVHEDFLMVIAHIVKYCCNHFQDSLNIKELLNQAILVVGYLSFDNPHIQQRCKQTKITMLLCNLPTPYIMDKKLIEILLPTICCLIYKCQSNFSQIFDQISHVLLLRFLKNESNQHSKITNSEQNIGSGMHQRKFSMSSLNSLNTQCSTNILLEKMSVYSSQHALRWRFPQNHWEELIIQLTALD